MHDDKPNNKQIREKRALNSKLAEAERRGYRRGVQDAAQKMERLGYGEFGDVILAILGKENTNGRS